MPLPVNGPMERTIGKETLNVSNQFCQSKQRRVNTNDLRGRPARAIVRDDAGGVARGDIVGLAVLAGR